MPCPLNIHGVEQVLSDQTLPNGNKICGYCGAWCRDQFMAYIQSIIGGEVTATYTTGTTRPGTDELWVFPRIEVNDHKDKIYVHQEGVKNASDGAIKIYIAHLQEGDVFLVNRVIKMAHDELRAARAPKH